MNEHQWLTAQDSRQMVYFLRQRDYSDRKFRLFACACCRSVWTYVPPRARVAVELAERFADGRAAEADVEDLRRKMRRQFDDALGEGMTDGDAAAFHTLTASARDAADNALRSAAIAPWIDLPETGREATSPLGAAVRAAERARQAEILRDIFGDAFQPAGFDG